MKLKNRGQKLTKSNETGESQKFGIGDVSVIIDILRDKLYSNKIRVIVQEYMSNATDAHLETGNKNKPIEVTLPTLFHPNFEVRDYGPGISPKRMQNVFCLYGASTKRNSNNPKGGFGIGAKSAWSYVDQYIVQTFIDGIERHYSMSIDETKNGEMNLLYTGETEEENGTKIIVPVKSHDFNNFAKWVYITAQWWNVSPVIHNEHEYESRYGYKNIDTVLSGDNWKLCDTYCDFHSGSIAVIDGIQYPISKNNIENLDSRAEYFLNNPVYFFFGTGEIDIAANREQLDYTNLTQTQLRTAIKSAIESVVSDVGQKVEKADNLWTAHILWQDNENKGLRRVVREVKWTAKDGTEFKVSSNPVAISFDMYSGFYGPRAHNVTPDNAGAWRRNVTSNVTFSATEPLVINDAERLPSIPRMRTLAQKTGFDSFQVVSFGSNYYDDNGNLKKDKLSEFIKEYKLDYMGVYFLSDIEKTKAPKAVRQFQKNRGKIYKLTHVTRNGFTSYPVKTSENLDELEGYWVPYDNRMMSFGVGKYSEVLKEGNSTIANLLNVIKEFMGLPADVKVYAIPKRYQSKIKNNDGLENLNDALAKEIKRKDAKEITDLYEKYILQDCINDLDQRDIDRLARLDILDRIVDDNSAFKRLLNLREKLLTLVRDTKNENKKIGPHYLTYLFGRLSIAKIKNLQTKLRDEIEEFEKLGETYEREYPLVYSYVTRYYYNLSFSQELIDDFVDYINLKDAKKSQKSSLK